MNRWAAARILLALVCAVGLAGKIAAAEPDQRLLLEQRVTALAAEMRCLVCQNQTLADSSAPLAIDLRNTMREQLARGASEREVIDFMTARYGDFVLYRPPFKASTALLWLGPFLLLAVGILVLLTRIRARLRAEALSDEERARAAQLLGEAEQ